MSQPPLPVLLVASEPALARRLQECLVVPPLVLQGRTASVAAAVEQASRGGLAAVVIAANQADLTAAHVAAIRAAGPRVVLITDGAPVAPALVAAGADPLPAAALSTPEPLIALLRAPGLPTAAGAAPPPEPAATALPPPPNRSYARRRAAQAVQRLAPATPTAGAPPTPAQAPTAPLPPPPAAARPPGRVIGLFGPTHGAPGVSLLAHGLADALAGEGQPGLLLDLDAAGDNLVALLAVAAPGPGLAALALARPEDVAAWLGLVEAELRSVGRHLLALPGLDRPADGALLSDGLVQALVAEARRRCAWVVIDLGRYHPGAWPRAARRACDELLLVVHPTLPGVAHARVTLRALADEGPLPGGALVLNRVTPRADQFPPDELAALGWPVLTSLPDDPRAAARATAQQQPVSRTDGALAQAIQALAAGLRARAPSLSPPPTTPAPRRRLPALPALRLPVPWRARPAPGPQ